jgi:hypothetical protein
VLPTTIFATAQHKGRRKIYKIDVPRAAADEEEEEEGGQPDDQKDGGGGESGGSSGGSQMSSSASNVTCIVEDHSSCGLALCAPLADKEPSETYPCRLMFSRSSFQGEARVPSMVWIQWIQWI